jgi:hypothetical protein
MSKTVSTAQLKPSFRLSLRAICIAIAVAIAVSAQTQQIQPHPSPRLPRLPASGCVSAVADGEVSAGASFAQPLGGGLSILLDPTSAGWVLRVLPTAGPRPPHDFAELATPPYKSVNPVLITTDFDFRAQDVVGWNPRHFQFFTRLSQATAAQHAYDAYMAHPNDIQAMQRLANMPQYAAVGDFSFLDARLLPGVANQSSAAAMVAVHFQTTAHTLVQAPVSQASALGRIEWMRFRLSLRLPAGFNLASGWKVDRSRCPR